MSNVNSPRSQQKFILHPLIHTFPLENSLQDVGDGFKAINCALRYLCFKKTGVAIDNIAHTKILGVCRCDESYEVGASSVPSQLCASSMLLKTFISNGRVMVSVMSWYILASPKGFPLPATKAVFPPLRLVRLRVLAERARFHTSLSVASIFPLRKSHKL